MSSATTGVSKEGGCEPPVLIAWIFGNPWPVCHLCRRHVYLDETAGEWRHFA